MKNFNNLIAMAHVMRHNSRTAVNPDGRTTVNRQSKLTSYRGWCKKLTMILAVLVLSIGQMWGADFTPAQIVASGGTTADHVKVSTVFSTATNKPFCSSETGLTGVNVNNSASANWNTYYIEIAATDGYTLSSLSLKVASNGSSNATEAVAFWNGAASGTCSSYASFTAPGYNNSSCANTVIDVPAGTKTVRLYRKICISKSDNKTFASSNKVDVGGSTTYYVFGITATASAGGGCGSTEQAALTLSSSSGTICGTGTTTFTVSGGSGSGALSVSSSDETKATASIDGSTVTVTGVAAGSATITVTKACDATYAEKTATYSATVAAIPTANAGVDKTTEPGNGVALAATAAASGCTGAWTIQSGPNTSTAQLSSTSLATATFTPTVAGTYTLRWTVTNTSSSCSAYDEMTVSAAVCSISSCGNATLTYPIYTSGDLTTSNLFSGATSSNATAVSVGASPAFTGVTVSAATKGSSASAGACYAKSTPLTGKMKYSASSKSSSYYIDFPFTVNTGYTFTPCDVQVVIQPVSSNQAFTVEITNGTNVYGTSTATLNAGVMEPIIGLTSPAEMSAGNYAVRLYPHGGSSKEFRMGANVILKGTTAAVASDAYGIYIGKNNDNYTLENLTNTSGTTWSKTITLDAGSYYEFKVKKTPSAGDAVWYGNNGKITATTSPAWDFNTSDGNCKLYTTVAGSYTFSWDASTNKLTVTYPAGDHPTKRIYMACGSGTWCDATPKFFVHSWGVTEYNTQVQQNACGEYYADIIWYNDYFQFTRNNSTATAYDDQNWNYSQDLTYNSSQLLWTFSSWSGNTGNFSSSAYTPTTYTISYAAGSTTATGGAAISGSKANETKTCGVDFTLPSSAVFTAIGYTQTGWTTSDGGAQEYALGGTYTTNEDKTFYPVWTVNQYTVTHTLDGVTKSSGATGANAATYGTNYTAVFAASSGYALPETITVTIGGSTKTQGTEYTWDKASGTVTITGSYITGDIVITVTGESDDPCTEPDEVANEIARFFVPCGLSNATSGSPTAWGVTNQDASTGDNTFTTSGFGGGSSNWYRNETSGLIYGKLSGNSSYILLKLKSGSFQAGDVVTAYFNRNDATKTGLTLKTQGSSYAITPGSTAAGVETSGTYTLVADAIEADGSIKLFRANSSSYVNRIIVTRPACTNVSITTQPTTPVAATVGSACSITGLVAAGTSPTYQWYTCNSDGSGATAITSAGAMSFTGYTSATLGLTPTAAGATYYKCVVSGSCGDPVTSNVVTVNASAAPASALITYNLNVGTSASTTIKSSTSTTDGTNITNIDIDQTNDGANGAGASDRTTKLALATGTTASAVAEPDKYEVFTFKVACGKKVTPSEVKIKVANVGGSAGGNQNYKAVLSDTYGHSISNTFTGTKSDGSVEEFSITNGSSVYFQGVVTLKLWSCKGSGGNASAFRMGTPLEIYGEVGNQATPAATITWNTQPANGSVGDADFAYDVTCSDGSTVTVTSANTTYATIVGGKLHYAAAGTTHLVATATDACGNTVTPVNSNDFTVSAAAPTYSVTHSLTNVTATSGATGAGAATEGVAYDAVFSANTGYVLPSTITVTIGGSPATVGTGYTWNASTGAFQVPAAQVTGAIVITIAGETAPATKDIYYGAITITTGALTRGSTGTVQFFTNTGGTIANNTEISLSTTLGAGSEYYLSNDLTGAELSKSSNWTTSSSSNRYVQGVKFGSGKSYTLALGSKVASSITFYGINGSASKTMTIGGQAWTSSSTKNTFAKHEFTKSGGFTGNVSITQDGDFYGILVITIQTATPCTTPVIPALSNQSLCEGTDIAEWDATQTAVLADGETVTYSWKKKGNDTELANTATFDLGSSATEAMAGTYVVTATVSKAGKASSTATKEVTLSVTDGIEVTGITADKATVYPTNSVTLTATASADATWQWYTCTSAEGAGAAIISGAESASYTIASAGAAGTYYYKAVATGSCGTDEMVYTLTVSAAAGGDCETEFWFAKATDKPESATAATHITGTPSGSSSATYTATIDGNSYPITGQTGQKTGNVTIVVPEDNEGTLYVVVQGSSSRTITLSKGGVQVGQYTPANSTWGTFTFSSLDAGTYTLVSSGNIGWGIIALKLCSGEACTDPEVTASVNNSTACVGSSVTFTATGAHASATYRWQKYSGGAWTDIAGAKAATYNIASVATTDAMKYRVIATKDCDRTSNEVTLNVPVAPVFADFTATRSVMATLALSITDVEASDATSYAWYKSVDATYDAGTDTRVGTAQELLLASGGEAAGATYYLFCVASNACGSTTSSAITVNVTALVEEDCATRGTEGAAEFGFQNSGCSQSTYNGTAVWSTGTSNSKILIYSAPDGKYFKTMKVTIASSSASKASYNWSTDGGSSYTADGVAITGVTTTLTEKTINLSAHGNVNEVKIGRNFGNGESSGTLYVSKICFEYTDACTATTVTPSATSKTHTIGASFSAPTFTLGPAAVSSGTLTYSSSDEEIASVDESGNVTFNGTAGTVTITASYAGATIAGVDYCASEGSYTITVSCEGGAPKIVAASSVNMSGCNSSVTLNAKTQAGADFAGGSYQWFHNGEEIDGATDASYTATQTGVYTVAYTSAGGCTSLSTNNATVTSTTVEPEVTKLVPFQYYHVDKTYTAQMKDRHLFSVKGSAAYGSTGKNFKLTMSRNGGAEKDITTAASIWVKRSDDGQVDNVMIDLNELSGKYNEGDELVLTCAAVDCSGNVSAVYKDEITIHVIGATPTLALICSGSNEAGGTRNTKKLTVGGDFLTGYNKADLCQQTGNTSFDANTEWGLYTRLKENYIVTPVNGYAVFNKLNYEPFDILLLTDYPKASKSDAAATVLDDMADLCDYRPMLSFKAHMVAKTPSKWAAKGFTTSPVVPKNTRTRLNIVCYAHPMFSTLKSTATHIQKDNDDPSQIVYTMLEGAGYEGSKGLQGFELEAAENFVTIGLVHYNATPADGSPSEGWVTWAPGSEDRMLVTAVERQENIEARMIMFAVNCGAQSKFTETGRNVVLKCLQYLLDDDPLHVADCSFTFDNGAGNSRDAAKQAEDCPTCTGTKGDGKWSTAANWGPDYVLRPGKDTEVKIAAPVTVDNGATNFTPKVRSVRIVEGGKIEIPAGSYLEVVSTIRRQDGNDLLPTEANDIVIGSSAEGNGTLIFNNNAGDTKARVDMYSTAKADAGLSAAASTWQYIGTPHTDVANARSNYYDSWLYQYDTGSQGWTVIPNGGPLVPFRGYCVTHPDAPVVFDMEGTLVATTSADIDVPANKYVVAANSWVAPIDINAITDDDMENISDKAIYFFNTGSDVDGTGTLNGGDRWAAGTYVSVPIHTAPYTGDDHIPSMQGFYVWSTTAGTLHLDYDRHVRATSRTNKISGRMHAPKRVQTGDNEPEVLKIFARGNRYDDRLVVLEREDFTRRYESGWDGEAWGGSDLSPMVYITNEAGVDEAVSAIPEFEGTVITFRAGEDSEYRFEFTYSGETDPLYLYDMDNNTYTQIMTGNAYYFTTSDKSPHKRFVLTRKAPQIATGVGNVSGDEVQGTKAKKLLIEDKMFIMVNGVLYDATGKIVK